MSHASLLVAIPQTKDIESAVAEQMAPFDENEEWFADGSRWDWYVIGGRWNNHMLDGNIIQIKDIHPNKFKERRMRQAKKAWESYQKEDRKWRGIMFGCDPDLSCEDFIKERTQGWFPAHYGFLSNRHWHERGRMGWWGCEAKTECELKNGESQVHRCKAKAKNAPEAYIVSWGDDKPTWDFKFYDRFVKPLDPETILVTVDYHV